MSRPDGEIAIVGGGALGLLLAAYLSRSASGVRLVTRTEEQAAQIRAEGITVVERDRAWTVSVSATSRLGAVEDAAHLVLAVKSYHLPEILSGWPISRRPISVLSIQNGLEASRLLMEFFGAARVVVAVTRLGARRTGPHSVVQAGHGLTTMGPVSPGTRTLVQAWAAWWRAARLLVAEVDDAAPALWTKAAINAAINPLAAMLGVTNGALLQETRWHWLMRAVVEEVQQVAATEGINLETDLYTAVLETLAETASNRCSMLEDLTAGRPTELDAITGEVIRRGLENGVAIPANEGLYQLMRARLSEARSG